MSSGDNPTKVATEPQTDSAPVLSAAQGKGGAAEERDRGFRTASEVIAAAPSETPWLLYPWIPLGGCTQITGVPFAGKSSLCLHMVRSVLYGGPFLDALATKSPVVYLSEGPETSFSKALQNCGLGAGDDSNLKIKFKHQYRQTHRHRERLLWEDIVEDAFEECVDVGARLLVVDTASKFMMFRGDGENKSGEVIQRFDILSTVAAAGISVLLLRHEGKGGSSGVTGRGSNAFEAEVDITISLRKPGDKSKDTIREIVTESRYAGDTPPHCYIEFLDDRYVYRDEADVKAESKAHAAQSKRNAILEALPVGEANAIDFPEVCQRTQFGDTVARTALNALVASGKVDQKTLPGTGSPRAYWLPEEPDPSVVQAEVLLSAADPPPKAAEETNVKQDERPLENPQKAAVSPPSPDAKNPSASDDSWFLECRSPEVFADRVTAARKHPPCFAGGNGARTKRPDGGVGFANLSEFCLMCPVNEYCAEETERRFGRVDLDDDDAESA